MSCEDKLDKFLRDRAGIININGFCEACSITDTWLRKLRTGKAVLTNNTITKINPVIDLITEGKLKNFLKL